MIVFGAQAIWFDGSVAYLIYVLGCGSLIIGMHRENIKRLISGNEPRIGQSVT
jgi:glycerol-3-phosphate acyltransferase PlsY